MPFHDTLLDADEAEEIGLGLRLRVPPPPRYAKRPSVAPASEDTTLDELLAIAMAMTEPVAPVAQARIARVAPVAAAARAARSTLPPPPLPTARHKVIPPSSPVGMLAHQITRQIEEHMTARPIPVTLQDTDVVCVEDDNPFVRGPVFFTQAPTPPREPRSRTRIRRSVILPWPAALMLLTIAGGAAYERAQRGDVRVLIETSVHSAHLASAAVVARIAK